MEWLLANEGMGASYFITFHKRELSSSLPDYLWCFPNDLNIWMEKGAMKNLFPIKPNHLAIYMAIFLLKRCKCLCWVHSLALEIHNQFLSSLCYCKIRYILNQGACRQGDWNFCSHIVRTNNVWIRCSMAAQPRNSLAVSIWATSENFHRELIVNGECLTRNIFSRCLCNLQGIKVCAKNPQISLMCSKRQKTLSQQKLFGSSSMCLALTQTSQTTRNAF